MYKFLEGSKTKLDVNYKKNVVTNPKHILRPIPGHMRYVISSQGLVFNGRILSDENANGSFFRLVLTALSVRFVKGQLLVRVTDNDGLHTIMPVAELMLMAFFEQPKLNRRTSYVIYADGNPLNVDITNIRWEDTEPRLDLIKAATINATMRARRRAVREERNAKKE